MTSEAQSQPVPGRVRQASRPTKVLAWALAMGSVAFAVVNVVFEMTGRFAEGPLSEYASGISIVNWFVAALKVLGAAVAVMSVSRRPWASARVVNVLIWGAAGVLGVYSLGSVGQAVAFALGIAGSRELIDAAGIAYVLGFVLSAVGFAVLATSHTRRFGLGIGWAVLGLLGGVALLGVIFIALPMLLSALGILPSG